MNPVVIQELGEALVGQSPSRARELIDSYFDKIIWSVEKEEWTKMSEDQKSEFVKKCSSS